LAPEESPEKPKPPRDIKIYIGKNVSLETTTYKNSNYISFLRVYPESSAAPKRFNINMQSIDRVMEALTIIKSNISA
jgi:hypothetical protein